MNTEELDAFFAKCDDVPTDWVPDSDAMVAKAPEDEDAEPELPERADSYYWQRGHPEPVHDWMAALYIEAVRRFEEAALARAPILPASSWFMAPSGTPPPAREPSEDPSWSRAGSWPVYTVFDESRSHAEALACGSSEIIFGFDPVYLSAEAARATARQMESLVAMVSFERFVLDEWVSEEPPRDRALRRRRERNTGPDLPPISQRGARR